MAKKRQREFDEVAVASVIGQFSVKDQDCDAVKAALGHNIDIEKWVDKMDLATATKVLLVSNEYKKQGHIDTVIRLLAAFYPEMGELEVLVV